MFVVIYILVMIEKWLCKVILIVLDNLLMLLLLIFIIVFIIFLFVGFVIC